MKLLHNVLNPIRNILYRVEKLLAGLALITLLVLSLFQILVRDLLETGYPSIDILIRHLVLIVIFMGAAMAVDEYRHIKLDVANNFMTLSMKWYIFRIMFLIASVVSATFSVYAGMFWLDELAYTPDNEKWAVPLLSVMPIGFALLSIHFFIAALLGLPKRDGH